MLSFSATFGPDKVSHGGKMDISADVEDVPPWPWTSSWAGAISLTPPPFALGCKRPLALDSCVAGVRFRARLCHSARLRATW